MSKPRSGIIIRDAKPEDAKFLWELSNDKMVRANSFSKDPISWGEHLNWFQGKIRDPLCLLFIATDNEGNPLGQIRFDFEEMNSELHYSLENRLRGKGYGLELVEAGLDALLQRRKVNKVNAWVKIDNFPSLKIFQRAGFERIKLLDRKGERFVHFMKEIRKSDGAKND